MISLIALVLLGANPSALYCYHQDGSRAGAYQVTNERLVVTQPVYGQLQCYRQNGEYVADYDPVTGVSLGDQTPMETLE